ncbi:MAG: carboxypeptidase regulatory-like domain-containing protein [Pirellulales bacterium]
MKLAKLIRGTVVTMTCFSMLTAQLVQAAQPLVRDIALQSSGVLQGQVLDTQGIPRAGVQVALTQHGKPVSMASTGRDGRFQMANLTGGVYEIQTPMGSNVYRLWAPRTAPPSAQDGVLVVAGDEVVRGFGNFGGGALGLLANPWVLAGIVAAAIAIPLAISDNNDAS